VKKEVCAYVFFLNLIGRYKGSKAARDLLATYFSYQEVKSYRELFIPTKYQEYSPAREDEPQLIHQSVKKYLLIPFLIKTVFNEKKLVINFTWCSVIREWAKRLL
jgi:hypothetical protein